MHTLCSIGLHNFLSLCTETLTNIYLHIYLRLVIYSSGTLGVSFLFISQICRLSMRRSGKPCTREQVSISFKLKMHSNKGSRSPRVYHSLLSVHPSYETRVTQTALGLSNTHDALPRGSLTSIHEHLFSTYIHRNVFQSYFVSGLLASEVCHHMKSQLSAGCVTVRLPDFVNEIERH